MWMRTLRIRWSGDGIQRKPQASGGRIYVLWHEKLLVFVDSHRNIEARMLISSHGDGEMLARIGSRFGFKPMRGSSTRGGTRALREFLRDARSGFDYGLTPDGPRGPRHEFKSGAIYFASRSGLPIVPTTVSYSKCHRLRTWDQFIIPRLFARGVVQFGEEIVVPPKLDADGLEQWRERLEAQLKDISEDTDARFEALYREGIPQRKGLTLQNGPRR